MRRKQTQFRYLNLVFFGIALCLILYLNLAPTRSKSFQWTTVRYKTSATILPADRGICPGLAESIKPALVVARTESEDADWLASLSDKYHLCTYTADAPLDLSSQYLQVPANRGHEAMAYLTFLVDNYASIPSAGAVFIHGSRFSWHNDHQAYDNKALLSALNTTSALANDGYHNLRCDWSASTCSASTEPQGSIATLTRAKLEPWNIRAVSDAALPRSIATLFGHESEVAANVKLGRADRVRAQCCAQFIVSRSSIHQHSRDEYIALRQWLLDSKNRVSPTSPRSATAAPADDLVAGRILSYIWHILFLRHEKTAEGLDLGSLNERACPKAADCYCALYGRCELRGCTSEGCPGMYVLPKGYRLPEDWAETHS